MTSGGRRRAGVVASVLALLVVLSGCSYVALGDSYTAGPLIPDQSTNPLGCLRSDHNYPHLVAPNLAGFVLRDVSCSGATTEDMTQAQDVTPGPANPPQLDALDATTLTVTLGIGGNDIGFSDIIKGCATLLPFGTPCQDRYVIDGDDTIANRIAATGPKVAAVLQEIHRRAPKARVFVVGYPAILPDSGSGCYPQMPLAPDDVPYLRAKEQQLNAMLAAQATTNDAVYVDTYTPSIGHDACQSPSVRWVEPILPAALAAPVHPNAAGMQGIATIVSAAITAG